MRVSQLIIAYYYCVSLFCSTYAAPVPAGGETDCQSAQKSSRGKRRRRERTRGKEKEEKEKCDFSWGNGEGIGGGRRGGKEEEGLLPSRGAEERKEGRKYLHISFLSLFLCLFGRW